MTVDVLLSKINVWDIIAEHFKSLRDASSDKASTPDVLLFYAAPVVPVVVLAAYGVRLTDSTISVLATALSILAGLLFNLLILLHSLHIEPRDADYDKLMSRFRGELHANIAYAIVVSLVALIPLVIGSYYGPLDWRRTGCGVLAIYLTIHFVLTMAMVLKRMDAMLQERMSPK
jgi:hypothetical protein